MLHMWSAKYQYIQINNLSCYWLHTFYAWVLALLCRWWNAKQIADAMASLESMSLKGRISSGLDGASAIELFCERNSPELPDYQTW